jgi:hypothetical protein
MSTQMCLTKNANNEALVRPKRVSHLKSAPVRPGAASPALEGALLEGRPHLQEKSCVSPV